MPPQLCDIRGVSAIIDELKGYVKLFSGRALEKGDHCLKVIA